MAWSESARRAAAEVRKRKAGVRVRVMDSSSGMSREMSRYDLARHTRSVRAIIRDPGTSKGRRKSYMSQLANNRFAAKKARAY